MLWVVTIGFVVVVLVSLAVYFFGTAYFEAWHEVQNKPREKMEWCWKHGMIRKRHCIDLGYTVVCPICYKKAIDDAERG